MTWQEYLGSMMTVAQVEQLKEALRDGKSIEVSGPQVATGKSTLAQILQGLGYLAFESHAVEKIELSEPLNHMQTGLITEMLYRRDEINEWLRSYQTTDTGEKLQEETAILERLAAPLVDWIRAHHGPHTEVHISWDHVWVRHDGIGIPFPYSGE